MEKLTKNKNKILFKALATVSCFSILFLAFADIAMGQTYQMLEKIPGFNNDSTTYVAGNLSELLNAIFKWGIGLAIALSFIMIVWGGIEYMGSAVPFLKAKGKEKIINALIGLVAALSIFWFLITIDPELVDLKLDVARLKPISGVETVSGGAQPSSDFRTEDDRIRALLLTYSVSIKENKCDHAGQSGCTAVAGLPSSAIMGLKNLKANCDAHFGKKLGEQGKCAVKVTGGTEGGHKSHGAGLAVVDLGHDTELDSFIKIKSSNQCKDTVLFNLKTGPKNVPVCKNVDSLGDFFNEDTAHWHVKFY